MRLALLILLSVWLPTASRADIILECKLITHCGPYTCTSIAGGIEASLIGTGDGGPWEFLSQLGHWVMWPDKTTHEEPSSFHQAWSGGQTAVLTVAEGKILLSIHRSKDGNLEPETFFGECPGESG